MRALPIRTWLVLALGAVVAAPTLAVTAALALFQPLPPDAPFLPPPHETVEREIVGAIEQWADPAWQSAIEPRLLASGLGLVLLDGDGHEVYRSLPTAPEVSAATTSASRAPGRVHIERRPVLPGTEFSVSDGEIHLGTAHLYALPQVRAFIPLRGESWERSLWLPQLAQWAALLLVALVVAWFVNRSLLRPLAGMGEAARRVAAGDLEVHVPASRVSEVAEVANALAAMGGALRASLERQAEMEQERRMMIGAVVHDLRTPLFALRAYVDGLAAGLADSPEKAARYLSVCRGKVDALERLVSDLFAYTRTEYLEEVPRRDPLDLGQVLAHTVDGLRPQAEAKGVELVVDGPCGPCPVAGDAYLLTRAVENLLDNAIRHTPEGGEVRVAWQRVDGGATFAVADTGPGIAPHDLPHLFAPLYRGEGSRNRRTGGSGLGLAIARRLLRAHGGDVVVMNGFKGGAVFTGLIPDAEPAAGTSQPGGEGVEAPA